MKNEHLMGYYCGKATRATECLALLLTLLLLLAACGGSGGSSSTNSSQAPASTPTVPKISDNTLTLSRAQQEAGYHLLSIPGTLTGYTLTKVDAFGPEGQKVYSLYYSIAKNKNPITIIEGQQMGNTGSTVSLRGTTGTLSTSKGITTLSWTENGVSRVIIGPLSSDQMITLAKSLI